jgi:hypothetical protein
MLIAELIAERIRDDALMKGVAVRIERDEPDDPEQVIISETRGYQEAAAQAPLWNTQYSVHVRARDHNRAFALCLRAYARLSGFIPKYGLSAVKVKGAITDFTWALGESTKWQEKSGRSTAQMTQQFGRNYNAVLRETETAFESKPGSSVVNKWFFGPGGMEAFQKDIHELERIPERLARDSSFNKAFVSEFATAVEGGFLTFSEELDKEMLAAQGVALETANVLVHASGTPVKNYERLLAIQDDIQKRQAAGIDVSSQLKAYEAITKGFAEKAGTIIKATADQIADALLPPTNQLEKAANSLKKSGEGLGVGMSRGADGVLRASIAIGDKIYTATGAAAENLQKAVNDKRGLGSLESIIKDAFASGQWDKSLNSPLEKAKMTAASAGQALEAGTAAAAANMEQVKIDAKQVWEELAASKKKPDETAANGTTEDVKDAASAIGDMGAKLEEAAAKALQYFRDMKTEAVNIGTAFGENLSKGITGAFATIGPMIDDLLSKSEMIRAANLPVTGGAGGMANFSPAVVSLSTVLQQENLTVQSLIKANSALESRMRSLEEALSRADFRTIKQEITMDIDITTQLPAQRIRQELQNVSAP